MIEPTRRSLAIGFAAAAAFVMLIAVAQHRGPVETLRAILNPASISFAQIAPEGVHEVGAGNVPDILAQPLSYQFLGFSNALARLFSRPPNDWMLPFFQGFYFVLTAGAVVFAIYLAYVLLHGRHSVPRPQAEILSFGVFFALMPLASITTHPHTFIFLLPTWSAIIALVALEPDIWRKGGLAALGGVGYLFIGFPAPIALVDRYFGTHLGLTAFFQDPIWANLALLVGLFAYATDLLQRTRESVSAKGTPS
jgi:hypothetical protein